MTYEEARQEAQKIWDVNNSQGIISTLAILIEEKAQLRTRLICTRVHDSAGLSHYADQCDLTRRERDTAMHPPAFNHSREDSPLAPCKECAADMSAPSLRLAIEDMRSVIDDAKRHGNEIARERDILYKRPTHFELARMKSHAAEAKAENVRLKKENDDLLTIDIRCLQEDNKTLRAERDRLKIEAGQHVAGICLPLRCGECRRDQEIERLKEIIKRRTEALVAETNKVGTAEARIASLGRMIHEAGLETEKRVREEGRLEGYERGKLTASAPVPMRLVCPSCAVLHVDEGEFATRGHHTHACQNCCHVWRPAIVDTVGVRFLPGLKNEPVGPLEARDFKRSIDVRVGPLGAEVTPGPVTITKIHRSSYMSMIGVCKWHLICSSPNCSGRL